MRPVLSLLPYMNRRIMALERIVDKPTTHLKIESAIVLTGLTNYPREYLTRPFFFPG